MEQAAEIELLSYEEALSRLETIVDSLENGQLPLEEAISTFELGQKLAERCSRLLEKAELKVKQISGEGNLEEIT